MKREGRKVRELYYLGSKMPALVHTRDGLKATERCERTRFPQSLFVRKERGEREGKRLPVASATYQKFPGCVGHPYIFGHF